LWRQREQAKEEEEKKSSGGGRGVSVFFCLFVYLLVGVNYVRQLVLLCFYTYGQGMKGRRWGAFASFFLSSFCVT